VTRRTEAPHDRATDVRQILLQITAVLGATVVLMALIVLAVILLGHDEAVVVGLAACALTIALASTVMRRATRIAAARDASIEQERQGRQQLDRTLAATRRLVELDSPGELRRAICEVAREVFECSAVSLWDVEPDHIVLLERVPWAQPYGGSDRRPVAELPGLREALDTATPLFIADLKETATGVTRATAEALGTGSLLNVPVAFGGVARLDLVLSWSEILPEPSETQRAAVQRFADQAGLALEQSRYRTAQAEIASLNRTLGRMVQTAPLFHAAGTLDEVAAAVCTEAQAVFEADAAALWIDTGDAIELAHRVPQSGAFGARQQILFSEHQTFAADLEDNQPRFLADVEHEDPVLWERFARHSNSRSQLRVPLTSSGPGRALMVLSWKQPVAPPSAQLSALASRFADQAGVALAEGARREAEREVSVLHAQFEESLLPSIVLEADDADVVTFYRPGDQRLSLGGDFYDCVETADGGLALLIGDVAGHGAAAAALGAGLRTAWRALVLAGHALEDLPADLQRVCVRERHDPYLFVTGICAEVPADRSVVRFVSAGHPGPLVSGTPPVGDEHNGPPLGVADDPVWRVSSLPLPAPASIILYTDGLVEGRATPGSAERLGIEPIEQRLGTVAPGTVGEADLGALVALASDANGVGLADDVALLALNLRLP
jgi:GAF domain-containing protein